VAIVGGLILSKYLAAHLTQRLFGYSHSQGHLIWSLSLPQVAATLATAIVAYKTKNPAGVRLIDEPMINAVLVLVVVTSLLGPVLTEHFGRQRLAEQEAAAKAAGFLPKTANEAVGEVSDLDAPGLTEMTATKAEQGAPATGHANAGPSASTASPT
jgi:hypothetical protein